MNDHLHPIFRDVLNSFLPKQNAADPFTDPTKAGTIFEDHSCYRCDSGNKPCIKGKGHERECDTLHARND